MTLSTHKNRKDRKAQISVEFMVVTSIVLLTFMVMSFIIYFKYVEYSDLSLDLRGKEIAKKFAENINQMVIVGDGYAKYISLQVRYPGDEYNITVWRDKPELLVENRWDWSVPLLTSKVYSCLPEAVSTCEKTVITVNSSKRIPIENHNNRVYIGPICSQDMALVSEWEFDEPDVDTGSIIHDSFGASNGILQGNDAALVDGLCGNGLQYGHGIRGNVTVPDNEALRPTTGITVMAWASPENMGYGHSVVTKSSSDSMTDGYGLTLSNDAFMHFYINDVEDHDVKAPADNNHGWTHYAGTYDLTVLRIYWNGTLGEEKYFSEPINHSMNNLTIGSKNWFGRIDDVKVFDRALTPEEIMAEYNKGIEST